MDRRIPRKKKSPLTLALLGALAALCLWGIVAGLGELSVPRMRVERDRVMISTVDRGPLGTLGTLDDGPEVTRLARGAFFQSTGGQWVFVVDGDGEQAVRRPVRLGRQTADHHEVLSGLEPGEKVITSSYETFGDAEKLILE